MDNLDITQVREEVVTEFSGSNQETSMMSLISMSDMETILSFGQDCAEEISKSSDTILKNLDFDEVDASNLVIKTLADILNKFDDREFMAKPSFWDKLFRRTKKKLNKMLEKYNSLAGEMDKIFIELKKSEADIKKSNIALDELLMADVKSYRHLVEYITAGEKRLEEAKAANENEQVVELLEKKVQDLKLAEMVAMQSIPMIQTMKYNNMNLMRKMESAFIVTMPAFKQSLAQAIIMKKQQVQSNVSFKPSVDLMLLGVQEASELNATRKSQMMEDMEKLDKLKASTKM